MTEKPPLLNSEGEGRLVPAHSAGKKFRWQPTSEFVLTVALLGDAMVIFAALCLGFWVRFESGLIPFHSTDQSISVIGSPIFSDEQIKDLPGLADRLRRQSDPVSAFLWQRLSMSDQESLAQYQGLSARSARVQNIVLQLLDEVVSGSSIYEPGRFKGVLLRTQTKDLLRQSPSGAKLARLNRLLLEDAYPLELAKNPVFFDYFKLLVMGTVFLLATFGYLRLHSQRCFMRYLRTARVIVQGTVFWLFAFLALSLILKFDPPISRLFMVSSFVCVAGAMLVWRLVFFKIMHWEFFAMNLRQRVLFVGWGKEAEQLEKEIRKDTSHPYEIIGCLPSPQGRLHRHPPASVPVLGDYQNLATLLEQRSAEIVILADLYMSMGEIIGMVNLCEMEFAQFKVIPSYFQILASGLRLETISGVPVLGISELPLDHFTNRLVKRVVDIVGALFGLMCSAPLIAIFGWMVYRESPGPIFYLQERTGKNGRSFKIIKIRSMRMDAEAKGAQWAKENDPRRLRIGAFMREWNIDEVPQFWNVLKGDMSLVGPRPERPELISKFKHEIPHYHARHSCLPGMTGWAQANGWRGNTSLEERIRFDIWYVENWSIGLDFRIMILTFLRQKNAY